MFVITSSGKLEIVSERIHPQSGDVVVFAGDRRRPRVRQQSMPTRRTVRAESSAPPKKINKCLRCHSVSLGTLHFSLHEDCGNQL